MIKVLKVFYGFVLEKRLWAVVFVLLIITTPLVDALLPYFYKLFVDAIPVLNFEKLLKLLLLYLGVYAVSRTLEALSYLVGDILTFDAGIKARQSVFRHIHDLDFAYHTKKSSGSLISAIKRGDGAFWDLHHSIHYRVVAVLVNFFVMMFFFSRLDMVIAVLAFVSFVAALWVTWVFVRMNVKTRDVFNEEEDKISAVIVDNMVNFETVKLFAKEDWEEKRLHERFIQWKKALWDFGLTFRFLDFSMGAVVVTSIFTMLYITLNSTISGRFSIGDFVLVVGFSSVFYSKVFDLVWGLRQIAKNFSDIQKYFGVLDIEIKVKDPVDPVTKVNFASEVCFKNVSFSYEKKSKNAIYNVDLRIRPGQSVALVGKSGAGKTTMVKLLMRFFDVKNGEVLIDNVNIKALSKANLRSHIGVVPQEPVLFNNTIGYNISYGREKVTKKELVAAAKMANIYDYINTLANKYETQVGERGIKLSGGQKQRIAIARMILSDPDIVIFDEATSQLDSESEKLIQDAFWKAVKNKTTIIIAHRLSTVMRADKIVVMEKGRIVEEGSHGELVNKESGLYKHLWELQTLNKN